MGTTDHWKPLIFSAILLSLLMVPERLRGETITLSARQAIEIGLKNNRTLKSLEHQFAASNYDVKSAVTGFLPQASLSGTYTRISGNDMFSQFLGSSLKNSYNVGVDVRQPIFTGFSLLNGLRIARTSRSLQETTNKKTEQTIRYAILQIYWGIVNLEKSENVSSEAIRQLEALAENQAAMLEEGMTTEHDYLLTNASLAEARMSKLEVTRTTSSMKRQFAILLGLPVNAEIELTDTVATRSVMSTPDADSAVVRGLENRPDLRETALQLKLSDYGVKQTRSTFFPNIVAGYSWSSSRPDQTMQDAWGDDWSAYVSLSFDLFKWGDRFFKVKKAQEEHMALSLLYEENRSTVEKEIRDACRLVGQLSQERDAAGLLVEAREKAYEASKAKHDEGVIPLYELLEAHSALVSAKFKALQTETDLELAVVNYEMGGLGTGLSKQ